MIDGSALLLYYLGRMFVTISMQRYYTTYYSVIITYRNNNKVINEPGAQCIHHFLALFEMDDAKLIANLASSLLENKAGFEIGNYK